MNKDEREIYYAQNLPLPETPEPKPGAMPWKTTNVVGKPVTSVDAYERTSGKAVYPSDVTFHDMLFAAILRCPHAHAVVKDVDTAEAEKMTGVRAVISATAGIDVLWPYTPDVKTKLFDPQCRFEGETVAAVAAETPYQAWDALRAVRVTYDVLPFVSDERKSLDAGAAQVHKEGNKVKADKYERGDIRMGFAEADVVLEQTYRNESELHAPSELHGCVAKWDGDALTIWESTQGVFAVQARVAEVLQLPLSKVRVIGHYMGGGFGSKLQADKYTIIAALLAKKTARPVKLFLSREETLLAAGNRPPNTVKIKAGVKKDGTLTALECSGIGSSGAYPAGGTALLDWLIRDLYLCPNVRTETTDVYINAGPARPFRAPGHPQGAWVLEQMLDSLAEAIKMDPVELRLKNVPTFSQARPNNPPYTTTGLQECLEKGAQAFGWKEAREKVAGQQKSGHIRKGVGVASGLWFAGGGNPPSTVIVKLFSDGSANLNMGASDIGTGTKTVMAMVVAEELGVKPEMLQIEYADTSTTQYATPSGGSKTVPTEAPTVRAAALNVKKQLLELAAEDLKTTSSDLVLNGNEVISLSDPSKKIRIAGITGLKKRGVIMGVGYRGLNPEGKVVNPFVAQFCEVEVNTRTGEVRIIRFLAAQDSGRVMNRLTFDNQTFGGITMGIGFAMTEGRILDRNQTGKLLNKNLHDYKLPTMLDVPVDMTSLPIDRPDPEANLTGAKGLGEPVTIPTGAALANAVYNATGVRVTETPMTPLELMKLFALHAMK
ncbi:MAG TPA: xanthine dehydrogenase family protein molybdopterin-binding subunit [Nitrospirota bacterium]|nr:xanthine dehydrogenase family protein molybdopterin-binding subunit [Nitrospirota bacterium]